MSEVDGAGKIVCNSCAVASVVKGSVAGEQCSAVCFDREDNVGRRGSGLHLRAWKRQSITLFNRVKMNAKHVSQSLRVVV